MNSIHAEFVKADDKFQNYIKKDDKFISRYDALYTSMCKFLEVSSVADRAFVDKISLGYALIDYFEDIDRLKRFHNIKHINSIKIVSYTSYWLLKRNVIQVKESSADLLYLNEKFVFSYIIEFLSDKNKQSILKKSNVGLRSFEDSLMYHLKYRLLSATSLEILIIAFFAGEIYQNEDVDLSDRLTRYDDPEKQSTE